VLNSPQYHRVHHSSLAMHYDKNFAALFPIFDVIFGTAYRPQAGEYPPSGLHEDEGPRSVFEATVWPLRRLMRTGLLMIGYPVRVTVIEGVIRPFRHLRWPAVALRRWTRQQN
jgi:hypothetical protein